MPNGLESISGLLTALQESTNNLSSASNRYHLDYTNNFNFVGSKLSQLNSNLNKINKSLNNIKQFNNESFKLFLMQKITSLEKTFKEMFTTSEIPVYDDDINNKIFFNLYHSTGEIIVEKQKLNFSNRINSLYTFPFNSLELGIGAGTYMMTVYYEHANRIFEFDGQLDVIDYVASKDGNLQRFILDNEVNDIFEDLRNYKIYLINKDGNSIVNKQTIINSRIDDTELDISCFSLLKDLGSLSNYKLILKEELFESVNIELNIGEFNFNDVASLILGNAERNLETGEFTVYDSLGNSLGTMVSTRFGKKEHRRRIL